jgi:hypothetical protein
MKNIHILPTDKSSRLTIRLKTNELISSYKEFVNQKYEDISLNQNQHIYITSDEEIKRGDYFLSLNEDESYLEVTLNDKVDDFNEYADEDWAENCKKVILTTDQDLIADGIQAIDEFLEWFVKNPTCEMVEVVKEMYMPQSNGKISDGKITHELSLNPSDNTLPFYKIIIPQEEPKKFGDSFEDLANVMSMANFMFGVKEEPKLRHQQIIDAVGGEDRFREIAGIKPKQETLEEAAVRIAYDSTEENKGFPQMKAFINGAKWQAERMYTEEDMKLSFETGRNFQLTGENNFNELIEQFKKK